MTKHKGTALVLALTMFLVALIGLGSTEQVHADTTKTGFVQDGNTTYYYDSNGTMAHGQRKIGNYYYYFDSSTGVMAQSKLVTLSTSEANDGPKTVYYDNQGHMLYGQQQINGYWYYFDDSSGAMKSSTYYYISSQDKIVYYDGSGHMLYGEQHIQNAWTYFDPSSGAQAKNDFVYLSNGNKTVYYNGSGHMVYGQQQIDGKWYLFDSNTGAMKTGFQYISDQNKTVYYDPSTGQMLYGQQKINGDWYYFNDSTGALQTAKDSSHTLHIASGGANISYLISGIDHMTTVARFDYIVDENNEPMFCIQFSKDSPDWVSYKAQSEADPKIAYLVNAFHKGDKYLTSDSRMNYYIIQYAIHLYDTPSLGNFKSSNGTAYWDKYNIEGRIKGIKAEADKATKAGVSYNNSLSLSNTAPSMKLNSADTEFVSDGTKVSSTGSGSISVGLTNATSNSYVTNQNGTRVNSANNGDTLYIHVPVNNLSGAVSPKLTLNGLYNNIRQIAYMYTTSNSKYQNMVRYEAVTVQNRLQATANTHINNMVNPPSAPIKAVTDTSGNDINNKQLSPNQDISYKVSQTVGTLGKDLAKKYDSFVYTDKLNSNLSYKDAYLVDSNGNKINNAGSASYDSDTRTVTYSLSSDYLKNSMKYNGEKYTLVIDAHLSNQATVKDDKGNATDIANTSQVAINNKFQLSNTTHNSVVPNTPSVTKHIVSGNSNVDSANISYGQTVEYISAINVGNTAPLTKIAINDNLASVLTYKSAKVIDVTNSSSPVDVTSFGSFSQSGNNVTWNFTDKDKLANFVGHKLEMHIYVTAKENADYSSYVVNNEIHVPNKINLTINSDNYQSNQPIVIPPKVNPSITKYIMDSNNNAQTSANVSYDNSYKYTSTVTVGNAVDLTKTQLVIEDDLAKPVTFQSLTVTDSNGQNITSSGHIDYDSNTHKMTWTVSDNPQQFVGQKLTATIKVMIPSTHDLTAYVSNGKINIPNTLQLKEGNTTYPSNTPIANPPAIASLQSSVVKIDTNSISNGLPFSVIVKGISDTFGSFSDYNGKQVGMKITDQKTGTTVYQGTQSLSSLLTNSEKGTKYTQWKGTLDISKIPNVSDYQKSSDKSIKFKVQLYTSTDDSKSYVFYNWDDQSFDSSALSSDGNVVAKGYIANNTNIGSSTSRISKPSNVSSDYSFNSVVAPQRVNTYLYQTGNNLKSIEETWEEYAGLVYQNTPTAKTGYGITSPVHLSYYGFLSQNQSKYASDGSNVNFGFPSSFVANNSSIAYPSDSQNHKASDGTTMLTDRLKTSASTSATTPSDLTSLSGYNKLSASDKQTISGINGAMPSSFNDEKGQMSNINYEFYARKASYNTGNVSLADTSDPVATNKAGADTSTSTTREADNKFYTPYWLKLGTYKTSFFKANTASSGKDQLGGNWLNLDFSNNLKFYGHMYLSQTDSNGGSSTSENSDELSIQPIISGKNSQSPKGFSANDKAWLKDSE